MIVNVFLEDCVVLFGVCGIFNLVSRDLNFFWFLVWLRLVIWVFKIGILVVESGLVKLIVV